MMAAHQGGVQSRQLPLPEGFLHQVDGAIRLVSADTAPDLSQTLIELPIQLECELNLARDALIG